MSVTRGQFERARPKLGGFTSGLGFSMVELMVVLVVITLLLALICPALSKARTAARQSRELSTGAQLIRAYQTYTIDARGLVMPGYAPSQFFARDETGAPVLGQSARRYPWRLAPYLDYTFGGLYEDGKILERYRARSDYQYVVSLSPSMGINADFVGGNDENGLSFGSAGAQAARVYGKIFIRRLDEAFNPASLLVFGSARGVDPEGGTVAGFHRIDAPALTGSRWTPDRFDADLPPEAYGNVHPRFGGAVVTTFLDGHGGVRTIDELRDMRLWADRASSPQWRLTPLTP